MDELWQVTIIGAEHELKQISEALEESLQPPLSVSLFEDELPKWRLEIVAGQDDLPACRAEIESMQSICVSIAKLPQKNWVLESLRYLTPVEAGRFYIHGSHDEPPETPCIVPICIPAGMAFGTGHHATTTGCLLAFEQIIETHINPVERVLDVGTGSGVLIMAAAKTLPAKCVATDLDETAIEVARENAVANGCAEKIGFLVADGLNHASLHDQQFDLVFANILARPLILLAEELAKAVAPKGKLVLAGLLTTQASKVLAAYERQGLQLDRSSELEEWTILQLQRP